MVTSKPLRLLVLAGLIGAGPVFATGTTNTAETTETGSVEVAADIEAGKKLYRKDCRGCHGPTGKGLASYPKLVGHPPEYLIDKLTRYRAGERFGPNTPLMAPRAKKLSDEDIANIAHFIVSIQ